jgi:hypothetical protein
MASIWTNVEVDVDADEWFSHAYEDERREMYKICKEHFNDVKSDKMSLMEAEFNAKLDELSNRYMSLTKEQFDLIMSI